MSQSVRGSFKAPDDSIRYVNALYRFIQNMSKKFAVRLYGFSDQLYETDTIHFSGKVTNISAPILQISNLFAHQNVGAMILASDGIYNQGANPVYQLSGIRFPVYTMALGDTVPKKDLRVEKIYHNQILYLGDKFKIAVDVSSSGFAQTTTQLSVAEISGKGEARKLYSEEITFTGNELKTREFILEATTPGVQRYRVELRPVIGEYTLVNNHKDFFIDVLDGRQKILLLAASPHPDIAALKQAIEHNKNYEIHVRFLDESGILNIQEYSLVVLHQIPGNVSALVDILQQINRGSTALWYVVGAQSNIIALNKAQSVLQIAATSGLTNEVGAYVNADFPIFSLSDNDKIQISRMPPLAAPFGQYRAQATAQVMLFQKIGTVFTDYPLLAFEESAGRKTAVLAGEGFWRWRLYDYQWHKNHDFTNKLIQQIVQYLSVREDKRPFKIILSKNIFHENEPIVLEGELYNESYQLINQPEVTLTVRNESGSSYEYAFSRSGNGYRLEIGGLPVGNYTFTALTQRGNKNHTFSGKFTIAPLQLESIHTVANHQLLYQISQLTGGNMYMPDEWALLEEALLANQSIKPTLFDTYKTDLLIHLKWLFFVITGLLSAEWFARKYMGGY